MRSKITKRLNTEWSHFTALPRSVRVVLLSYTFLLIAYPLMGVFINAFLWRQAEDVKYLIAYNMGNFIGLPLGFYLNGFLLKRTHIKNLYFLGAVLQGLIPLILVFSNFISTPSLFFYGLVFGLGGGLYWANKNYLSLKLTQGINRIYYNSLESIIDLIIAIIIPFATGMIIVTGQKYGWYSLDDGYRITMLLGMATLTVSGLIIYFSSIKDYQINALWVNHPSHEWNLNRIYYAIYDTIFGLNHFLPSILVLLLLGDEGVLGALESLTAGITALLLYVIGRKLQIPRLFSVLFWSWIVYLAATAILTIRFDAIAVVIFLIAMKAVGSLRITSSYTVSMEVMDRQIEGKDKRSQYAYICDNELFFNLGRIIGTIIFSLVLVWGSDAVAIRYTVLLLVAIQGFTLFPIKKLITFISK